MHLHTATNVDILSHELAEWMIADIRKTLKSNDRYTLVLSGGSTPKKLYGLLAAKPYRDQIDWQKMHIFFGDERYVPFNDAQNNGKMACDTLLSHVPVPQRQIHYMDTTLPPERSAEEYGNLLHQYFGGHPHTFDLVLLGMGDDGHTLSLFPGTAVIHEQKDWVKAYFVKKLDMYRITLTSPVVNQSAKVLFLAAGEKKAAVLKEVLEGPANPDLYPSQVIRPRGNLYWFVDEAAASQLKNE